MSTAPASVSRSRPRRPHLTRGLALAAVLAFLASAVPALAAPGDEWSPEETQFAYELNRARWDPSRVGITDGSVLPAPPLSFNHTLAAAGGARADEMAEFDYFAHQSPVTGLWPNEIARANGYPLPQFWPGEANNIESIHYGSPTVEGVLQSLIDSPPHRVHLMGEGWFGTHLEIGVGANLEDRIWAVLTATAETDERFLTGVAYDDVNGNRRMDIGEGVPGVTVRAGTHSTTTSATGGWSIPVLPGRYRVTAKGGVFDVKSVATVRVGEFNVQVDFISGKRRAQVYSYETCAGRTPTILGTGGNDRIIGTPGDDVIVGGGGRDVIKGMGGRDIICGGAGDDVLRGGPGKDLLIGGWGSDLCLGEKTRLCEEV